MTEAGGDDREPLMGLRLRPPPGEFPGSVGWAMLLMLLAAVQDLVLGLVLAAESIPLAAVSYGLAAGFLTLAVGLARLRRWAWVASLGWGALGMSLGGATMLARHDPRYLPVLPMVATALLLFPAARRAIWPSGPPR